MGATSYRFSIAWTRILPEGVGQINQKGIEYYNNLINELIAFNITPAITLYHWDLPQSLDEQGRWLNPDVAFWFEEYARVAYQAFGDRVKTWITLNEPWVCAIQGYGNGEKAPGMRAPGILPYKAAHNMIRAHAKAYRVYYAEFQEIQKGQVGITLNVDWYQPVDDTNADDVEASNIKMNFHAGWFAHPIYVDGKYPEIMRSKIDAKSEAQGFLESRLPQFTEEDSQEILGSSDFFGLNYYTSNLVTKTPEDEIDHAALGWATDSDVTDFKDSKWYAAASSWLKVTPFGLRKVTNWLYQSYQKPIYVTENGFSDYLGNVDDLQRIYYYKHYINQLLKAIKLDGVDVRGYYAWSLMDNFEWARGYR